MLISIFMKCDFPLLIQIKSEFTNNNNLKFVSLISEIILYEMTNLTLIAYIY